MKKTILILLIAVFGGSWINDVNAQSKYGEDSVKCRENLYIYYELARKKQWLDAYESWRFVIENCPQSSKNNVIYGPYIVEAKIDEAKENAQPEVEAEFKTLLMRVYDIRNREFPGQECYVNSRKVLDMVEHYPDSTQMAYDIFSSVLDECGSRQSAAFYNYYFVTAARLFNEDVFGVEDVFTAYNVVIEGIEVNTDSLNRFIAKCTFERDSNATELDTKQKNELAKAERELERYQTVASNIEKILAPIATCDKLNLIYNDESFEQNKTDTLWLKRAVKMLQKEREGKDGEMEDCTDIPIYFNISDALYKLEPSAPAARAMFIMSAKEKNYSQSVKYIKEAIALEIDPLKRADDYLRLARAYQAMGSLSSAISAARKAASSKKNWGAPYITLAQAYAAADGQCGSNVCEKKAVYWAAIDKLQYAKSIDPSVSNRANRLIAAYKEQLPGKGVCFQLKYTDGTQYTIGCFINETVTMDFN